MLYQSRTGKVNVKVLIILLVVVVSLGVSLVIARQVRRNILSQRDLAAGLAAFEQEDWQAAVTSLREYLGRNPDDTEIFKKYAKAMLSRRPLEMASVGTAIAAYRRVLQLDPTDQSAYEELAGLYGGTQQFTELAYIAEMRLAQDPSDLQAPLWRANALIQLDRSAEALEVLEPYVQRVAAMPGTHRQYVQACLQMSVACANNEAIEAKATALQWLDKAVAYDPNSPDALVRRAQFLRTYPQIPGLTPEQARARARADLETADQLNSDDPKIVYALGTEWMEQGELEHAATVQAELDAIPAEKIKEQFLDPNDWQVARFLFVAELATRQGVTEKAASLADGILDLLTEERHRAQVIPVIVPVYVALDRVADARACLDEYLEILAPLQINVQQQQEKAWLQGLVASAEGRPYTVIDVLAPVAQRDSLDPTMWRLWRLLADAYNRTNQPARAISAAQQCLRLRPTDSQMRAVLASQYSKTGQWQQAYDAATTAEMNGATNLATTLLRIGSGINLALGQDEPARETQLRSLSAELSSLRQRYPDDVNVRIFQALVAGELGQPEDTEDLLKLAIEQCAEPLPAEMQLLMHYVGTGRTADAIAVGEAACERHPEVAQPWVTLADVYTRDANVAEARTVLERGLSSVTDSEKRAVSVPLALAEYMDGDRESGRSRLEALAAQDANDIEVRRILLATSEVQADREEAARLIAELKQAEGQSGLWWRYYEAVQWLSLDNWRSRQQDIVDRLQYCIAADAKWVQPVLVLAGMYERLGDTQRELDVYRQAFTRNPAATDIASRLLAVLQEQGRVAEADLVLQQMQASPQVKSDLSIRTALGFDDTDRAIEEYELRAMGNPQDARSRVQLARLVYAEKGDADQALAYLDQAEALDPNLQTLAAVRATVLRGEGQEQQAQQVLDDYVAEHNDFDAHWMRAVFLTEVGAWERAENDYRALPQFADNAVAGYELLSNFYAETGRLDQAVAAIEEGLTALPDDQRLKRDIMQLLFTRAQGTDRARALEILAELEAQTPNDPGLLAIRAGQLLQESAPQLADITNKLKAVVDREPRAVDAYLMLIEIYLRQGAFEDARSAATQALAANPNNPDLLTARARTEVALGDPQAAIPGLKAYCSTSEGAANVAALVTLTDLYRLAGQTVEARQTIAQAASIDPNSQAVVHAELLCVIAEQRYDELEGFGARYLSTGTPDPTMLLNAAFALLACEPPGPTEAVPLFERAVEQTPTTLNARIGLAASLRRSGEMDRAEEICQKLLTDNGSDLTTCATIASRMYQMGDVQDAEEMYRYVIEHDPENASALNDLAWILQAERQQYAEALILADRGLAAAPDDEHLLDTRATILSRMPDRLADAKREFERLIELSDPDSRRRAQSLVKLARVCVELGESDAARAALQRARTIDERAGVLTADERSEISEMMP